MSKEMSPIGTFKTSIYNGDTSDCTEIINVYSEEQVNELLNKIVHMKTAFEYIVKSNDKALGFVNSNLKYYIRDTLDSIGEEMD